MKLTQPSIVNSQHERIDTWVEELGESVKANVIFVHGLGTDKHETAHYFDDLASALVADSYRVIRFDLTGYGQSEGNEEDACYTKHTDDLKIVVNWVRTNYQEPMYILAQSMGCWVTALANLDGITKTIMTGIPNHDPDIIVKRLKSRFAKRPGAKFNMDAISLLPRSTGKIQKIGPKFWQDIRALDPLKIVHDFAIKTKLLIIHWQQDEIIGSECIDGYDVMPNVKFMYLPGNHSLTNLLDRERFIKIMLDYFNE